MSHPEQRTFCERVMAAYAPTLGEAARVLDCGSLDINGNNRYLFWFTDDYFGIDICAGPNVDWIGRVHDYTAFGHSYDVVISTEMLEHDEYYRESLLAMAEMLRPGGLLIFTCATTGRPEHGTQRTTPADSPMTPYYYKNLTAIDIQAVPGFLAQFSPFMFDGDDNRKDLYFHGIKRA